MGGAGKSAAATDGAVDGKKLQNLDSFNAQAMAKKQQRGRGGGRPSVAKEGHAA